MGISFEDAQALDAQGNSAPTIAPGQQPPAAPQAMTWDQAQTANAPPAPTHPTRAPSGDALTDTVNFLRTAAIHAGSGLVSLTSQAGASGATGVPGLPSNPTGYTPPISQNEVEDYAFNSKLGPEYQPQTEGGKLAMGATSGALAGLATGGESLPAVVANVVRGAVAGGAGQGASDLGLSPWLGPAATAFLELAGRSAVGAAKVGAPGVAAVKQAVTAPGQLGANAAGRVLANADNTGAALPAVSNTDVANAAASVQNATGAITANAAEPWQVGQQVRDDLTARQTALTAARSSAADDAYAAFRQQPPIAADKLFPFMSSPTFRNAIKAANGAVLDEGGEPLSGYVRFNEAGDPIELTNAAVPPDVLDRIRQQLGANVGQAAQGPAQRTASMLANRFDQFLQDQYPATDTYPGYAAIRTQFKANSAPLDPLSTGAPAKVLDNNRPYGGAPQYTMAPDQVPDLFLRGPAVKTNLDQLATAYGGDKAAAEGALEQHLAGVASNAIDPATGELDQAAFTRAMAPYQKALNGNGGMWFPQLKKNFANAQAAQSTLDTLTAQKAVGDSIVSGGLRGTEGHVTAASFNDWLSVNKDAIGTAQGPQAAARLQQIGNALKIAGKSGGTATAIEDAVPAVAGALTGGADLGILGSMIGGKVTRALLSPWTTRYAGAFNAAIERAVRDPAYARQLVAQLPKGNYSPLEALRMFGKTIQPALTTAPRTAAIAGLLASPTGARQ